MALVVTFRVPAHVCKLLIHGYGTPAVDQNYIKADIKRILESAINEGLPPLVQEIAATTPTERINLSLNDANARKVVALATGLGVPNSIACQQLVMAAADAGAMQMEDALPSGVELLEEAWKATGKDVRVAQAQVYADLNDALSDGGVGMVEAATGTGKTLAMVLAAEKLLRATQESRVVIASPTISLIRQFANTHRELEVSGFSVHPIRCILGRREFVCPSEIIEVSKKAEYAEFRDRVHEWMKDGGLPTPNSPIQQRWLVHSLLEILPGFPAEACILPDTPDDDDPGWVEYRHQFDHAEHETQEILLCTHAMLSISTRLKLFAASRDQTFVELRKHESLLIGRMRDEESADIKKTIKEDLTSTQATRLAHGAEITQNSGRLPPFRYLMVDEAHQLESIMSSSNANYVSLNSLLSAAQACHEAKLGISMEKLKHIRADLAQIKALSTQSEILMDGSQAYSDKARVLLERVASNCHVTGKRKDLTPQQSVLMNRLKYDRLILESAISGKSGLRAVLRFSPIREFPQVFVGSSTVNGLMEALWGSVKAAACVSATLYLRREGGFSAGYLRAILNIPAHRLHEYKPVSPAWVYTPVQAVWTTELCEVEGLKGKKRTWLRPPTRSDKFVDDQQRADFERLWIDDVADAIQHIHATSAGGVLVLMTSYDSIAKLASKLPDDLLDIAIVGSPKESIFAQSHGFMHLSKQGHKPLWLATGAAWTGLDIGGHEPWQALFGEKIPADMDNVLTDLVIPRIPYGLNKSLTHSHRVSARPGIPWEMLDTMFRLKQGFGRLIRRMGLPDNRRLFLLDGRIHEKAFAGVMAQINMLLKPYKREVVTRKMWFGESKKNNASL